MNPLAALIAAVVLSACTALGGTYPADVKPVSDIRGTVRLVHGIYEGTVVGNASAVVVAPGVLVTAKHVTDIIDQGPELYIEPEHIKVTSYRVHPDSDVAVMIVPGIDCPCAVLADLDPAIDYPVSIIGWPMNAAVGIQIRTEGFMQGYYEDMITTTANATGGNSGGGIFSDGKLVAILVEGFEGRSITRGVRLRMILQVLDGVLSFVH